MLSGAVPWNENVSLPWQRGGHPLAADSGYQVAAADLCQLPPQCQQGLKQLQKAQVEARACSNNGLAVWEGAMSCEIRQQQLGHFHSISGASLMTTCNCRVTLQGTSSSSVFAPGSVVLLLIQADVPHHEMKRLA